MVTENVYPFRSHNSEGRKPSTFTITKVDINTQNFNEFRVRVVEVLNLFIQNIPVLKEVWTAEDFGEDILIEMPLGRGYALVPFHITSNVWQVAKKRDRNYTQALIQFLVMSLVSFMLDLTPDTDATASAVIAKSLICKAAAALVVSRLSDATTPCVQNTLNIPDFDGYYKNVAVMLSEIASSSVVVSYNADELLIDGMPDGKPITINIAALRACDQDMFVINANIVTAIVALVKKDTKGVALMQNLPTLVQSYITTRNLPEGKGTEAQTPKPKPKPKPKPQQTP